MGSRQIVLVSTAGISVFNAGIFWREAKTKRLFLQCMLKSRNLDSPFLFPPLTPHPFRASYSMSVAEKSLILTYVECKGL